MGSGEFTRLIKLHDNPNKPIKLGFDTEIDGIHYHNCDSLFGKKAPEELRTLHGHHEFTAKQWPIHASFRSKLGEFRPFQIEGATKDRINEVLNLCKILAQSHLTLQQQLVESKPLSPPVSPQSSATQEPSDSAVNSPWLVPEFLQAIRDAIKCAVKNSVEDVEKAKKMQEALQTDVHHDWRHKEDWLYEFIKTIIERFGYDTKKSLPDSRLDQASATMRRYWRTIITRKQITDLIKIINTVGQTKQKQFSSRKINPAFIPFAVHSYASIISCKKTDGFIKSMEQTRKKNTSETLLKYFKTTENNIAYFQQQNESRHKKSILSRLLGFFTPTEKKKHNNGDRKPESSLGSEQKTGENPDTPSETPQKTV